jgi:hypothetical protein
MKVKPIFSVAMDVTIRNYWAITYMYKCAHYPENHIHLVPNYIFTVHIPYSLLRFICERVNYCYFKYDKLCFLSCQNMTIALALCVLTSQTYISPPSPLLAGVVTAVHGREAIL